MRGLLCYAKPPSGVHLTPDGRKTYCGLAVLDIPEVPRQIAPLRCPHCSAEALRLSAVRR